MKIEDLKKEVAGIKWFHTIDLGNGIITPGYDNSTLRLKRIKMPENLTGLTVLDIGAWDGFFSFEAERRGASKVLAVDLPAWDEEGWGSKAGFELARKVFNSKVQDREIDVLDISPERIGTFDLVLFLGVLYHMRHPLLALERVFSVTKKQLILETHVDMLWHKRSVMAFYPGAELNEDPSNWYGPNPAAVEAMLKIVGFQRVKIVAQCEPFPYRLGAAVYRKIKNKRPFFPRLQQSRMVFHAWRGIDKKTSP